MRFRRRRLADRDVVPETTRADIAPGRDVRDEVPPEPDDVVLVVAAAAVFERHADLAGAGVRGQGRVAECVARVPDLNLLDPAEVVVPVERHHLDVRLREVLVRARIPREPDLAADARRANHGVAWKAPAEPVPAIRRRRGERVLGPARDIDVPPEVRVRPLREREDAHLARAVMAGPEDLVAGVLRE